MSRRFWAGLMLMALAIAAGSTYVILGKLADRPQPRAVPLKKIPPPHAAPAVTTSTATVSVSSPTTPVAAAVEKKAAPAAPVAKPAPRGKRNVLFRLSRPAAREVVIVGDFNKWTPHAMKKNGKAWQTSVPLAPGKYEYAFIVDGKRTRDPNNRQTNSTGKSSVLTVKPLAVHP